MATSGTAVWNPNLIEIIEEAYERAGVEIRSGYEFRSAIRSINFLMAEWANRGLNLWTIEQDTIAASPNVQTYTLPADTVDVIEAVVRDSSNTDITMERYTVSQWAQIPVKNPQTGAVGLPVVYYVQRLETAPIMNIWPTPNTPYTIVYWRMRRLQDAGGGINTTDMPYRFLPALVAGLAYYVALKDKPAKQDRIMPLKQAYEEAWQMAADEDRDRSSFFFVPYTSLYS